MQTQHKFISRFSPNRTDPEDLERINVQREDLLARSIAAIRESVLTANKHHLLFIGPRGSGKSHLLALIAHRLQGQPELAEGLRLAWLNEDETSTSFLDLLLRIYRALAERYPAEFPLGEIEQLAGRDRAEALDLLGKTLVSRAGRRTILVMLENLDTLFRQLDETDQRAWRAFIQNHPVFATVATAQSLFAGVSKRDEPFFGFFDTTHLQPFTAEEATELLQRIAQLNQDTALVEFLATPRGKARVQAIHHLSGGNPRLYIVLSDFITRQSLDELVRPFEGMVDEQLTPYYQERLRWLSPQQRKIVEFLCLRGRPAPVKEIAAALFAEQTSIASQLLKLREMRYVKTNPRGRESLYELAEPLMRLSMEVKSTHNHQPLRLLVDFLRVWFEREEIEQRLAKMDATASAREYFNAALDKLRSGEPNLRHQLLREGLEGVRLEQCEDSELEDMRTLAEETTSWHDWLRYGLASYHRERFNEAIEALTKVIQQPEVPTETAARALYVRAGMLMQMGRTRDGISDFTRLVECQDAPVEQVVLALYARGAALQQAGQTQQAISDYTQLVERRDIPMGEFGSELVARALANRGEIFLRSGQAQQAITDFTRLVELSDAPPDQIAKALLNRGVAFAQLGQTAESLADGKRVIGMPHAPVDSIVGVYYNRGLVLAQMGKMEEAISDYTRAIEWPEAPINHVAAALNNRGTEFAQTGRSDEAISDWTRVIELESAPVEPLAMALNNRALLLSQTGQTARAIADFERVISLPEVPANQAAKAKVKLAESFFRLGQWDSGIKYLGDCLKERVAFAITEAGDAALDAILRQVGSPEIWRCRLTAMAELYTEYGCISDLGDVLVRHLAKLAKSPLSSEGLDQWLTGWEAAGSGQSALQLPLRLLRAGIAYLKTEPRDEGVLLQLPSEERTLVRQALGLPDEPAK